MAADRIDSYIDIDSVRGETKEMLDEMNKLLKEFKKFDNISISLSNVKGTKELKELSRQVAEVTQKVVSTQKELDRVTMETQLARQKANKELKTEIELQTAASGSIDKARAAIKLYTAERNKLDLTTEQGIKRQKELNAAIDEQNDFIKKNVDQQAAQRLNVGNYQGSAKIIVDALGDVEKKIEGLREKQTQLQNLSASNPIGFKLGNQASELNQVNAELEEATQQYQALNNVTSNPKFLKLAGDFADARTEVKGFTTTLIELERQGLGNTGFATELRQRLAQLTDEIGDTRAEIKALSSDTRTFDQFSSSIAFLANSYEAFVGIQALAGDQSEETQETIKKLVAVQSISNGLQEVANQLTSRGTLVNKAYTFVQTQYALATDASAAATTRLAAATKLIGIGLLVGAIAFVVSKLGEWSKAAANVSQEQETLNEVTLKAADSYGQEKAKLDLLIATLKTEGISRKQKFETLKQLQESFPGYFDNIKTEADLNNNLALAYENATKGILAKAKAQAASSLLQENFSKQLKLETQLQDEIAVATKAYQKNLENAQDVGQTERLAPTFLNDLKNRIAELSSDYDNEISAIKEKNNILVKTVIDSNKEVDALGGKIAGNKEIKAPKAAKADDQALKDLQARFEKYKLLTERELELIAETRDSETAAYTDRLVAATEYAIKKQKLISDEAEFEKKTKKLSKPEKELVDTKAFVERQRIAEESEKKIFDIQEKYRTKTVALSAIEIDKYSESYDRLKAALDDYAKKQAEIKEKEKDLYKERIDRVKDFVNQVKEATFEIFTFSVENQQNEISEEEKKLEERRTRQIDEANQTIANTDERERKIREIEVRSEAEKHQLERRNAALEERKARIAKAAALLNIGITAAQEVFKIKAQAAVLLSNPFTAALAAVALSQIPIVLLGAGIAAGLVAAKPIPKFWRGKDKSNTYEGLAWVGDGGKSELIVREDGKLEMTPATDTLTYIGAKDEVYPDANAVFKNGAIELNKTINSGSYAKQTNAIDADKIIKGIVKGLNNLGAGFDRSIKNIPKPVIKNAIVESWVRGSDSIDRLNNY